MKVLQKAVGDRLAPGPSKIPTISDGGSTTDSAPRANDAPAPHWRENARIHYPVRPLRPISCFALLALVLTAVPRSLAAGRQLTGPFAPAPTPALAPAEAQKKFKLPDGFEIRLFAAEPDIVNPVAMTWDERGRLWVLELYEYPL